MHSASMQSQINIAYTVRWLTVATPLCYDAVSLVRRSNIARSTMRARSDVQVFPHCISTFAMLQPPAKTRENSRKLYLDTPSPRPLSEGANRTRYQQRYFF
ncbi:hypothetical protein PMIN07_008916 [Paraphaeosphaeria minitans]